MAVTPDFVMYTQRNAKNGETATSKAVPSLAKKKSLIFGRFSEAGGRRRVSLAGLTIPFSNNLLR
jgi:hypothetical protein